MTALTESRGAEAPARPATQPLRVVLLTVIALALLTLGGGLAVVLGLGAEAAPATPTADSVEAGFSRDMAVHHLQGAEMANLALERSDDPEVRQLAFDISATQTNQVGRMQGWLTLWGLPLTGVEQMAWMGGTEHDAGAMGGMDMGSALMPGMATQEELDRLRTLSGPEFDVEFLRLMIRHHQGGSEMARYAAENADQVSVRSLARSIADTQAAETTTMTAMLTARGGTPLPPP